MKTILAPVDFSTASHEVVAAATTLARALSARVVFLSVLQPPPLVVEYPAVIPNLAEITAAGERDVARRLAEMEQPLRAEGLEAESVQLSGEPIRNIVAQAEKLSADYIVMGSHGHSAIYDLLVGSTTHGVLLRAKCPVVIVPTPHGKVRARTWKEEHAMV